MLIIVILFTILAIYLCKKTIDDYIIIGCASGTGAIVFGIIGLIMIGFIIYYMSNGIIASNKIEMYQEENNQIQDSIDTIVSKYMNYENSILKEFKSESPVTYVSLYPQLQSDELVKKQIDLYISNNNKIKELKEQKIEMKIGQWLLYFG